MRALIQRVKNASVIVDNETIANTGRGLLVLIGIKAGDGRAQIDYLVDKIVNLRVFEDEKGRFDKSVSDIEGDILLVPQFTLYGDCAKGRRPDFTAAAPVENAKMIYDEAVKAFIETGLKIESGRFQAHMEVNLVNDGPVTLMIESK